MRKMATVFLISLCVGCAPTITIDPNNLITATQTTCKQAELEVPVVNNGVVVTTIKVPVHDESRTRQCQNAWNNVFAMTQSGFERVAIKGLDVVERVGIAGVPIAGMGYIAKVGFDAAGDHYDAGGDITNGNSNKNPIADSNNDNSTDNTNNSDNSDNSNHSDNRSNYENPVNNSNQGNPVDNRYDYNNPNNLP